MSLILIVEDSRAMAEAAAGVLRKAGHDTVIALGISEAFSSCQERRPDLVLTEYYIHDGTAINLLEKLARLKLPPVIVATGCGHEMAAAGVLAAGASCYRVKTDSYLLDLPSMATEVLRAFNEKQLENERGLLKRRLEAQNELAGWLAHNFKNILAASIGYINLIDLNNPNQDKARQAEYLDESRKGQESAIRLLEQLIRMTGDNEGGEAERIVIAEVIDEAWERAKERVLENFREQHPERLEEIQGKIPKIVFINSSRLIPPQQMVRADLGSIMEALLQNALEAVLGTEDARVLAGAELKDKRLELVIKDNGRGMDANVLRHAAEPLFSTKGEVGVGLSLSLVSSLALRHGGDFTLKSKPGQGSTARIICPV